VVESRAGFETLYLAVSDRRPRRDDLGFGLLPRICMCFRVSFWKKLGGFGPRVKKRRAVVVELAPRLGSKSRDSG